MYDKGLLVALVLSKDDFLRLIDNRNKKLRMLIDTYKVNDKLIDYKERVKDRFGRESE